jgi:hypothetical protein
LFTCGLAQTATESSGEFFRSVEDIQLKSIEIFVAGEVGLDPSLGYSPPSARYSGHSYAVSVINYNVGELDILRYLRRQAAKGVNIFYPPDCYYMYSRLH